MKFFFDFVHRPAAYLERRFLDEHFELRDDRYVSRCAGRLFGKKVIETIDRNAITSWCIVPEMGMDIILINCSDGIRFVWFDRHNDLIALLRQIMPESQLQDMAPEADRSPSA
jgi:hypothetical protein